MSLIEGEQHIDCSEVRGPSFVHDVDARRSRDQLARALLTHRNHLGRFNLLRSRLLLFHRKRTRIHRHSKFLSPVPGRDSLKHPHFGKLRIGPYYCVFDLLLNIGPIWNRGGGFGFFLDFTAFSAAFDSSLLAFDVVLDGISYTCREQLSRVPLLAIADFGYREIGKSGGHRKDPDDDCGRDKRGPGVKLQRRQLEGTSSLHRLIYWGVATRKDYTATQA